MKKIAATLMFILQFIIAIAQRTLNDYVIAYNIHMPDTTKDDWEIYTMDTDGSNITNITNNKDVAWTYHSCNGKIYFVSDADTAYRNYFLYETDADGKNKRKVSDIRLEDSWMSTRNNCKEMIVSGRIGKEIRQQLFLINVATGKYTQLTNDTAASYLDPCFSPDGKQIVFSYRKNKRDKAKREELYLMNSDGSGSKQLTYYPENNISAKEFGYRAGTAQWHPTENFVSYISKQNGMHSIFAVTPDGKKQWKLIDSKLSDGWHNWSEDGNYLVYNSADAQESQFHIMLMNWKTKETKQLSGNIFKSQQAPVLVEKKR